MASPKQPRKRSNTDKPAFEDLPYRRSYPPRPVAGPTEVVNPLWLLRAVGIVIGAALVCGYGSLCLLLYQGQWQLILHPKQTAIVPANLAGTPIELVRFGTDESATPQLTGWSIPPVAGARFAQTTILFLPSGNGSLVDAVPALTLLHNLGARIFAIDYRGYGQSVAVHPNEARMTQDAEMAFQYLTGSRAVPERDIVLYGSGVAASLAVHLAALHPGVPAVILDSPGPDPLTTILSDPRTRFLPVQWLLHDRFLLTGLSTLRTPKFIIETGGASRVFPSAADPKRGIFELPPPSSPSYTPIIAGKLKGFLEEFLAPTGTQTP